MKRQGLLVGDAELVLTDRGRRVLTDFEIDVIGLEAGRRPICRYCLDWSERRGHLGGALGAAILFQLIERGWASETKDVSSLLPSSVFGASTHSSL